MKRQILIITIFAGLLSLTQTSSAQNIGETTFHFKDESRNRPVVTEVWYPTVDTARPQDNTHYPFIHVPTIRDGKPADQKCPLIVISHGTGGGRLTLEWLADELVQNGFIVAAVDHYGNTYDNKIAEDFVEPWRRPLDISYAITALLNDKTFGSHIDAARIGAAGFSIGGYTVLALAGAQLDLLALEKYFSTPGGAKEMHIPEFPDIERHLDSSAVLASFNSCPPLKDSRIKAFFAICPAIGQGFTTEKQFSAVHAPVYIVGAQSDSIAPVKTNAAHYHLLIRGSKLTIVPGKVGHYVFLNEATEAYKKQAPFPFTDDPSVNRHEVHLRVAKLAVDFFKENLK